MKRTQKSDHLPPLLAFGAHPDDIEFAVGGVIVKETSAGRPVHLIICSAGESATNGTPAQRKKEAHKSAAILGADCQFIHLDGDAHLEIKSEHAIALAKIIRQIRPGIVLAPTLIENQHPDHPKLGHLVRDAARLARYGGLRELRALRPHVIDQLLFYANTPDAEPRDMTPLLIDVSDPKILNAWTAAMQAHASQMATRNYVELHLTAARLNGLRAGVGSAIALFSADPLIVDSLSQIGRAARRF